MVDGKEVIITAQEYDEFFNEIVQAPRGRIYTPREQALIVEGYRRGVNVEALALKLHTSRSTMRRWYLQYQKEHGE